MNDSAAFPTPAQDMRSMGLTKLEYTAIHAMNGMMAACDPFREVDTTTLAEGAVNIAKALFAELDK